VVLLSIFGADYPQIAPHFNILSEEPECLQAIARHPIICASATAGVISGTVNASIIAAGSHKVDRLKSRDQLERELTRIYERVLHQSSIDRCDNFFELGGHSLMLLSLVEEVRALTYRNLPLTALSKPRRLKVSLLLFSKREPNGKRCPITQPPKMGEAGAPRRSVGLLGLAYEPIWRSPHARIPDGAGEEVLNG
jgi:hypothetical protein